MNKIEQAEKILDEYNQEKVKVIFNKLDENQKNKLAEEIISTNMGEILNLYKNKNEKSEFQKNIEPIEAINKNKLSKEEIEDLQNIGAEVIKNDQYAVVTMAGGQGTRLGFNGPKGAFQLDLGEEKKYVFEEIINTLKKANTLYGKEIYWYIMTSRENQAQTVQFLEEHNYFGYNKNKVIFFLQGELPLLDKQGNLIINKNFEIKKGSNGNGGIFKGLKECGIIDDMKAKNIKWVCISPVDNIMLNIVDTLTLGLAIKNNVQSLSKSVKKMYPEERVGVFCRRDGKPSIIEYIDMTEEMIYRKNKYDDLAFGDANIMYHLFDINTVEELSRYDLIYHCAEKKSAYINEDLEEIVPEETNAYKFESFIFDFFEKLDNMLVLRINREDEFAPLKNAKGVDSPESVKMIYEDYHKRHSC